MFTAYTHNSPTPVNWKQAGISALVVRSNISFESISPYLVFRQAFINKALIFVFNAIKYKGKYHECDSHTTVSED